MNYSSEERWFVLRQLYEMHAISLEWLAIVADKKFKTVQRRAEKQNWMARGADALEPEKLAAIVGRLVMLVENCLNDLLRDGETSLNAEKQLRIYTTFANTCQKSLSLIVEINKQSARSGKNGADDEAADTGEDILALRQNVETFIDTIGEEEIDPSLSAEPE